MGRCRRPAALTAVLTVYAKSLGKSACAGGENTANRLHRLDIARVRAKFR
jgi:hypothetical protein